MLRVVSERGFLRFRKSKSDFAPGVVVLRAVRMLMSATCPVLVFGSKPKGPKLVQNSCMCTSFDDGGEINFTIKTAFFFEIFLALTPATHILSSGTTLSGAYCFGKPISTE